MGTQSTWGVQSELVMETKRLIFLLLAAIAGCFAAPGVQDQLDPNNMDHMALVELKKFVEGNLMKDVNETRIFTEKSSNTSGEIAIAIIKYANKFNSESAARLTQTLKNLTTSIDANLEAIVDNSKKNHKTLEKQRDKKESGINTLVTDGFETLLDKVEKRLSEHEKLLSTNVAICAERRDSESALGAKGKITYDDMFLTSVTIGGKAMNRTELKEVFKPSQGDFMVPEGGAGLYEISFTAIIDTRLDSDDSLAPANFLFATERGEEKTKMIETSLTASTGRKGGDKASASRTILLDLQANDKVYLLQISDVAEKSYRFTLCVHLVQPEAPPTWASLPEVLVQEDDPEIESYIEPKDKPLLLLDSLLVGDLSTKDPEVVMPEPETDLRSPRTKFFNKIPTRVFTQSHLLDPIQSNPNDLGL